MDYKKEEIKEYFDDFISDYFEQQDPEWIEDNKDDLHHHAFNTDYFIIAFRFYCIDRFRKLIFHFNSKFIDYFYSIFCYFLSRICSC